ncbi:hypothetical protein BDY21DRAFT_356750 [Lineolata rhizophorae]|uniref:NmrA-like domain-containing protein n=1 Tax=Lineolata rhizophorae TaxID=578093 RepID=A0A6A6NPG5_9PEZI|nr:hypothetical protein BDY21DRAFT_356750 [Lineolata rhizophorae]
MAYLVTGGTGKTGMRLARLLKDASLPVLLASRRGAAGALDGFEAVRFDWTDKSTFENPFTHTFPNGEQIKGVYLVPPEMPEPAPAMNEFIDYAMSRGVRRFALLAGTSATKGGPFVGKVWEKLADSGVECGILSPTWFMENFTEWLHPQTIKNENKFYTACGDGKTAFISANDVALCEFHALTDEKPVNDNILVTGSECLSMDDVAAIVGKVAGRKIEHVRISPEETTKRHLESGMPEYLAQYIGFLESNTSRGSEAWERSDVEKLTRKPPQRFTEWAEEHKNEF